MADDLTLSTPLGQPKDPGPPPPMPEGKPAETPDLATWYRSNMDNLIPKFEAATKAAQDSIAQRRTELADLKTRTLGAPGLPEPPETPLAPAAPKITSRPFLAGGPGDDAFTSLNKAMAGLGLIAQMGMGIKGGYPQGALAAYTGALQGWKAGDIRRGANEWQTYLGELQTYDRDVASIRQKYDDLIRKWGADQDRLKTEMGILAAEHGLGREAIEMSFREPMMAFDQLNTTAKILSDLQANAANLALKNAMWLDDRTLKLMKMEQDQKQHAEKMAAEKEKTKGAKLTDESTLRQQYLTQSKDFNTISDSYGRLLAAAKTPSAAGDLALIFNYMKMLDPGSVVRETEFANAQNAAGVPERLRAQWNRALSGERLSDVTRADFVAQAQGQYGSQAQAQQVRQKQFRGIAESAGMDPLRAVPDLTVQWQTPSGSGGQPGLPTGAKMEGGKIVSESGKFIWDGSAWQPR